MKKFVYNTIPDGLIKFINDNKEEFKKRFGNSFDYVYNYPFVLKYPDYEFFPQKICECCGQRIEGTQECHSWENGFRPDIKDFFIDLFKIGSVLNEINYQKNNKGLPELLRKEYDEFILETKNTI